MIKRKIDGVEISITDTDKYLQINDITGTDLNRIWEKIQNEYSTYKKWLCYHNTEMPTKLLSKIGAALVDDSVELRLNTDTCNYLNQTPCIEQIVIEQITEDTFEVFADYHNECNPDMYWTSERINRDLSRWGIFTLNSNNQITDYLILAMLGPVAEIFCVDVTNEYNSTSLISFAAKYAFDNGKNDVLYMADDNSVGYNAALSIGFKITGFYKGYMVKRM
jgi:hypothetical protein